MNDDEFFILVTKAKNDKSISEEIEKKLSGDNDSSKSIFDSFDELQNRSAELDQRNHENQKLKLELRKIISTIENSPIEDISNDELTEDKINTIYVMKTRNYINNSINNNNNAKIYGFSNPLNKKKY